MRKLLIFSIMLFLVLQLCSSCAAVRVTSQGAVPVTTVNGEVERTKTIHTFLGSQKTWTEDLCNGAPPAEVTVEPNFLYSLLNVATIGIWAPVKVKYKCNENCEN